ncbi:MAG: HD domain-containing protein [Deltaproteobacteria bacterium]|nr:MAG: HD domain-containing protein [Deltaproteobacteria bacterium]
MERSNGGTGEGWEPRKSGKDIGRESMNWEEFIEALFEMAEPYLGTRGDLLHTQVAHEYALLLMEKEGGDRRIVEPAIILHDVGWSRLDPDEIEGAFGVRAAGEKAARINRVHELGGAVIARELLEELAYDPSLIDQIIPIVERHDSGREVKSLEEKLVKDADKLWRFSQVGYRNEMERQKLTPLERYQFLVKNLPSWFFTETAKELAERELGKRAQEFEKDLMPE